jgi:hypothetical protein
VPVNGTEVSRRAVEIALVVARSNNARVTAFRKCSMWQPISTAPFGSNLELAVIERLGGYDPFSGLVRAPARPTSEKVDLLLGVSADRV